MSAVSIPHLSPAEADGRLDRARAVAAALGTTLADLQAHPGYRFLDGAPLVGGSLRRWTAARQTVAALRNGVAAYRSVVERAEAVRRRRSGPGPAELTELDALLSGPAVVLETRVSMAEAVAGLTARYQEVAALVTAAHAVLSAHAAALDELAGHLAGARRLAAALGLPETGPGPLDRLDAELDDVRALVRTDPLALSPGPGAEVDTGRVRTIRTELTAAEIELRALAAFRAESAERLRQAEADIERVGDEVESAVAAVRLARSGIAETNLPALSGSGTALREHLERTRACCAGSDWLRAADELVALDRAIADVRARAERCRELAGALLDRRAELRGRLDAYQARAERLGCAPEAALVSGARRAHHLLWTAPCDLAAATQALNAYQRLIAQRERGR